MRIGLVKKYGDFENIFEYDSLSLADSRTLSESILEDCNMPMTKEDMVKELQKRESECEKIDRFTKSKMNLVKALFEIKEEVDNDTFLKLCDAAENETNFMDVLVLTNSVLEEINKIKSDKYSSNKTPTYVGYSLTPMTPYKTYLFFDSKQKLDDAYTELLEKGYITTENVNIIMNKSFGITEVYSVKNRKQEEI